MFVLWILTDWEIRDTKLKFAVTLKNVQNVFMVTNVNLRMVDESFVMWYVIQNTRQNCVKNIGSLVTAHTARDAIFYTTKQMNLT